MADFIYDINTKNLSFLFVSNQLKKKGVKNNKFMLKLYDKSLVGVDPRSDNLTAEQKIRIYNEICRNKWYYIREVVLIPDTGSDGIPYKLNLGNLAQSFAVSKNLNFISLLPRQQGKTIGCVIEHTWIMLFATKGCQAIYLNKQYPDAIENGRRFKAIKELLPRFLQTIIKHKHDKDNVNEKFISRLKNQLLIKSSATSAAQADKLGRGLTSAIIYKDELAFMNKVDIIYDACVPAWRTAAENAKRNGVPYGMHFTTTPNNIDTETGKWAHKFISECTPFRYEFYDMTESEIKRFMKKNGKKPFVHIQYSWQEIGRTQDWYDEMCSQMSSELKKKRELDLVWTNSIDNGLFSTEDMEIVNSYAKDSVFVLRVDVDIEVKGKVINRIPYFIDFYELPDLKQRYILSCDVAGGTNQDSSVINIIHPSDFRIVGDIASSKIDINLFGSLIDKLMTSYFINSLLVVERNSYGKAILDRLIKNPQLEPRIYKKKSVKEASVTKEYSKKIEKKRFEYTYGVHTDRYSRPLMFSMLTAIVRDEPDVFVSKKIINELGTLVEIKGKPQASPGCHDDSVMSYLVFRYAVSDGDFFKQYGILNHRVFNIENIEEVRAKTLRATVSINHIESRFLNGGTKNNDGIVTSASRDFDSGAYYGKEEDFTPTEDRLQNTFKKWNS